MSFDKTIADHGAALAPCPFAPAFLDIIRGNTINAALLNGLPRLRLPQCYLTAGCLFQTVWNHRSGFAADALIKDYDIFYYDDTDLSWESEDANIQRAQDLFGGLGVTLEVKNQARVHLWYAQKFAAPYPILKSARDGIDRYLVQCTCLGVDAASGALYAPNGLEQAWAGVLQANPLNPNQALFLKKAREYKSRWPSLSIAEE